MAINFNYPQTFETSVLISDTFTPINGSPGSINPQLSLGLNSQPISCALEVRSTLGGLLWPRMTTVQRLNLNPGNALTVYDTTLDQFYGYAGGVWAAIGTGGGGGVSSVSGTAGQISVANPTTTPVISLTNTTVVAGNYVNSSISVDAQGRITAAASGGGPGGGTVTSISQGANIVISPNPLTTTGSVALATALTGITSAAIGNFTISGNSIVDAVNSGTVALQATGTSTSLAISAAGAGSSVTITSNSGITLTNTNGDINLFSSNGHIISAQKVEVRSNSALQLNNAANSFSTSLIAGSAIANTTYTLPTAFPLQTGQVMTSTTGGVMGWFSKIIDIGSPNNILFFGTGSGNATLTGTNNVGVGESVLSALTTGSNNFALSSQGGKVLTTGSSNLLCGFNSGLALVSGSSNLFFGTNAGSKVVSSSNNLAFGTSALLNAVVNTDCLAFGTLALAALSSGIGAGNNNIALGTSAAPLLQQGSNNIFAGQNSAAAAISATESVVIGHGAFSTAGAFDNCTIVGNDASFAASGTASQLTFIGKGCGTTTGSIFNSSAIGYNAQVNASNNVILGNACKVGIGTDTATYTLHMFNVSNECSLGMVPTTNTPTIGGTGFLLYSNGNIPTFRNNGGIVAPAGTVTSVTGTAGNISSTGGSTPVIDLVSTAVTPASYNYSSITVDAKGRLTAASNGAAPVLIAGSTMTGALILNANPTNPLGAATKQYVDAISAGFTVKTPCTAGTISNLTATYSNGAAGVGATLTNSGAQAAFSTDGVTPAINSRVLVRSQSTTFQNGIYQLSTVGSGSTNWVLTRTTDYDQAAEILPGTFVIVEQGTTLANTGWIETATVTTIGTDPILFSQFGGGGGGAPTASKYLLQVSDPSLPNAQSMGALATGLVKNTTSTGVQSIAVAGTDFYSLNNPTRLIDDALLNNVFVGRSAGNISVSAGDNCAFGIQCGVSMTTATQNSLYGRSAGLNITTSNANSLYGYLAGNTLTTNPGGNTFLGFQAGSGMITSDSCTFVGLNCGITQTTGTNITLLGHASSMGADTLTNATAIGANSSIAVSNGLSLGNNCLVGINQASPTYTLHISNAQNQAVVYLANTLSNPSTPFGGGVIYVSNGQLVYRGSSGTITVLAAA